MTDFHILVFLLLSWVIGFWIGQAVGRMDRDDDDRGV